MKSKVLEKASINLFDKNIPLRIVKGDIIEFQIKTWTRYYDRDDNILRFGEDEPDSIFKESEYQELELNLKTIHYDSYIGANHHDARSKLFFERNSLFEGFEVGQTISYFGLYLAEGSVWTNYFLYNHDTGQCYKLYHTDFISERFFNHHYTSTELRNELDKGIEHINRNPPYTR